MNSLKKLAALALACLLAACAGLLGPREVTLPLYKLQAALEQNFPLNNRALDMFNVHLSRPQLRLQPDGRVFLAMDSTVAPPFTSQSWAGSFGVSGRLGIDAARGAVLLRDARVENFRMDGASPDAQRQFSRIANVLLTNVFRDIPVYAFRPDELRLAGVQFMPTRVTTTSSGLVVTLEPEPR